MKIFIILILFIAIVAFIAWYLISKDKGQKEPISALWLAFLLGIAGAVLAIIIENYIVSVKNTEVGAPLKDLFGNFLLVGFIEESIKFLPLAFLIFNKKYFNEHTDGIIYFALVGLGFGLPENILYALSFGSSTGIGRLFLTPFFHATTVAIVGFYLVRAKISHGSFRPVALSLLAVIVLHALYDFGLTSSNQSLALLSIIITVVLSVNLFILYYKATKLDQLQGLAEVGYNNYCRTCGTFNNHHMMYCNRCGQRT